jgi:hypothetical protein
MGFIGVVAQHSSMYVGNGPLPRVVAAVNIAIFVSTGLRHTFPCQRRLPVATAGEDTGEQMARWESHEMIFYPFLIDA